MRFVILVSLFVGSLAAPQFFFGTGTPRNTEIRPFQDLFGSRGRSLTLGTPALPDSFFSRLTTNFQQPLDKSSAGSSVAKSLDAVPVASEPVAVEALVSAEPIVAKAPVENTAPVEAVVEIAAPLEAPTVVDAEIPVEVAVQVEPEAAVEVEATLEAADPTPAETEVKSEVAVEVAVPVEVETALEVEAALDSAAPTDTEVAVNSAGPVEVEPQVEAIVPVETSALVDTDIPVETVVAEKTTQEESAVEVNVIKSVSEIIQDHVVKIEAGADVAIEEVPTENKSDAVILPDNLSADLALGETIPDTIPETIVEEEPSAVEEKAAVVESEVTVKVEEAVTDATLREEAESQTDAALTIEDAITDSPIVEEDILIPEASEMQAVFVKAPESMFITDNIETTDKSIIETATEEISLIETAAAEISFQHPLANNEDSIVEVTNSIPSLPVDTIQDLLDEQETSTGVPALVLETVQIDSTTLAAIVEDDLVEAITGAPVQEEKISSLKETSLDTETESRQETETVAVELAPVPTLNVAELSTDLDNEASAAVGQSEAVIAIVKVEPVVEVSADFPNETPSVVEEADSVIGITEPESGLKSVEKPISGTDEIVPVDQVPSEQENLEAAPETEAILLETKSETVDTPIVQVAVEAKSPIVQAIKSENSASENLIQGSGKSISAAAPTQQVQPTFSFLSPPVVRSFGFAANPSPVVAVSPVLHNGAFVDPRGLVAARFRQHIYSNDAPEVVAAKVALFRLHAALNPALRAGRV